VVAGEVDVMAMAMNPWVWSEKRSQGLQQPGAESLSRKRSIPLPARTCKTPLQGPLWGLGDGPVAAFDEACAGDGGGGEGEGEVSGFWFGEAGDGG